MSFSALPRELREEIVRLVDEQDRTRSLRRKGGGSTHLAFSVSGGLEALSRVNKDLRSLALPFLYDPLNLSYVDEPDVPTLPTTQIGQACRSVTFRRGYRNNSWLGRARGLQPPLELFDQLPELKEVDLSECGYELYSLFKRLEQETDEPETGQAPSPVAAGGNGATSSPEGGDEPDGEEEDSDEDDWDSSDVPDETPANPAVISKLALIGTRISSWKFGHCDPEIPYAFLSLAPSSIKSLSLYDFPSNRATTPSDYAVDAPTYMTRIASLPNLTSLSLYVDELFLPGNNELPALHPAWSGIPFSSAASLTSLAIHCIQQTDVVNNLISSFATSLQSLTLDCSYDMHDTDPLHLRLPAVRTFSLSSSTLMYAVLLYFQFDCPALQTLELALQEPPENKNAAMLAVFTRGALTKASIGSTPELQVIKLRDGSHTGRCPWPSACVKKLASYCAEAKRSPPIRVESPWPREDNLEAKGKDLPKALKRVRELADWMKEHAERLEETQDEVVAARLVKTAEMVAGLKEYEEE